MEYDFEFDFTTLSSNSEMSDDDFCDVRKGNYYRFESFDDDIDIIKSEILYDQLNTSIGEHFKYDSEDDIVIVEPETISSSLQIYDDDKVDVNQNSDFIYVPKNGEVVKEISGSELITTEKEVRPFFVLRSHLRAKRTSFLNKLKNDKYSGIFRRKSKLLPRTQSVPKIVVHRTNHDFDSAYEYDDDLQVLIHSFEEESSSQKLHVSSKKKDTRKSI